MVGGAPSVGEPPLDAMDPPVCPQVDTEIEKLGERLDRLTDKLSGKVRGSGGRARLSDAVARITPVTSY